MGAATDIVAPILAGSSDTRAEPGASSAIAASAKVEAAAEIASCLDIINVVGSGDPFRNAACPC